MGGGDGGEATRDEGKKERRTGEGRGEGGERRAEWKGDPRKMKVEERRKKERRKSGLRIPGHEEEKLEVDERGRAREGD